MCPPLASLHSEGLLSSPGSCTQCSCGPCRHYLQSSALIPYSPCPCSGWPLCSLCLPSSPWQLAAHTLSPPGRPAPSLSAGVPSRHPRTGGNVPPQGESGWSLGSKAARCLPLPLWHSCSGSAKSYVSAIPSSITWTHVSGLKPLVEPCLKQTLKLLPRPDVWNALGPVPSACLLFLGAYYQAWSQQVSATYLPSSCALPPVPSLLVPFLPLPLYGFGCK